MAEYIERELLINHVEDLPTWGADGNMLDREDVIGSIENRLAADVAPVRHGHWIRKPHWCVSCSYCGKCTHDYEGEAELYNYCPYCGSKMDEVK